MEIAAGVTVFDTMSEFFYDPLDYISNFFYDPWTFWGVPVILALIWEGYRWLKDRLSERSRPR
jgi:hypothetical protein